MPNSFLTPSHIAAEGLRILENELVLAKKVHTDYSSEFQHVGDTISIRRPTAYAGQANNLDVTSYTEDVVQGKTTISLDKTFTVRVKLSSLEKTLSFDRFSEDIIRPVMVKMRDKVETDLAALYTNFYWYGGTPGTPPATFLALAGMRTIMTDAGIPMSDRIAIHGGDAAVALADGLKSVFVQDKVKTALEQASIGRYAGFENYESVHAPTHLVGAHAGTPRVNGVNQNVTYATAKDSWSQTLNTDGWSNDVTGVVRAGDIFTIANVFAVNPVSKVSTGKLQTFTVLATANSGASTGPAALTISPPIITSGAYQTVNSVPADDALITVKTGTASTPYRQSLLMHPKALALVTRPLDIPQGAGLKTSTKTGNHVTISVSEWVDGNTLDHSIRFDMLYGVKCIDPRLGARLTS